MKKIILLTLLTIPMMLFALPSDKQQEVTINAKSSEINAKNGVSTFMGDVRFSQGSIQIRGNNVTVKTGKNDQLEAVIAKGKRAEFWEQPQKHKPKIYAWGNTIEYFPDKNQVIIAGNAETKQGQNQMSSPVIHYNTLTQVATSPYSAKGHTQIIVTPTKQKATG